MSYADYGILIRCYVDQATTKVQMLGQVVLISGGKQATLTLRENSLVTNGRYITHKDHKSIRPVHQVCRIDFLEHWTTPP
jgi:hypothetical protein